MISLTIHKLPEIHLETESTAIRFSRNKIKTGIPLCRKRNILQFLTINDDIRFILCLIYSMIKQISPIFIRKLDGWEAVDPEAVSV